MFRRIGSVAFPLAAVACGFYYRDDLKVFASTVIEKIPINFSSSNPTITTSPSQTFYAEHEFKPWNSNWDLREPITLIDPLKYENADEETQKEMLEKVQPTAIRHIFLIRHGQFFTPTKEASERRLTELGKEQAALLGNRLNETGIKYDRLVMSTMIRAMETAQLVLEILPIQRIKMDSLLEEGAPYPSEPLVYPEWKPKKYYRDGARIEAAFRKYIHRASVYQKENSHEVIVCHANVIRYFVCRALQFPPEGWHRMSLGHTSITWLVIHPNGLVELRSIGDIGHCHPNKITFQ